MGAGVQPSVATLHHFDGQAALLQVSLVYRGDFQLAARTGLDGFGDVHHLVVVKIQAGDRKVAFRLFGLFFDAGGCARLVKRHHAITLWVVHMVGKYGGTAGLLVCIGQQGVQVVAVKDVVTQHQRTGAVANELLTDDEGLRQAVRAGLNGIAQVHAPLAAIAQQLLETRCVLRGADDEYVANTSQHQRAERVVNHGLVIHRQQLFANGQGGGVKAGA